MHTPVTISPLFPDLSLASYFLLHIKQASFSDLPGTSPDGLSLFNCLSLIVAPKTTFTFLIMST